MTRTRFIEALLLLALLSASLCANAALIAKGDNDIKDVLDVKIDDFEGDQSKEVFFLTQSGVTVLNGTGGILWSQEILKPKAIAIVDVDNDKYKEVVVSSGEIVNKVERGNFYVFDKSGKQTYKFEYTTGKQYPHLIYYSLEGIDIDKDGYSELVGGGSNGVHVIKDTFDQIRWSYMANETISKVTIVEDVSATGDIEKRIVAFSYGTLYTLDSSGRLLNQSNVSEGIDSTYIGDVTSDTGLEILVLTKQEAVYLFSSGLKLFQKLDVSSGMTTAGLFDTNDDGMKDIVVASKRGVYLLNKRLVTVNRSLMNGTLNTLVFTDWDNDNKKEIIAGSGSELVSIDTSGYVKNRYDTGHAMSKFYVSDLDDNGFLDIILISDGKVFFMENNESSIKEMAHELYINATAFLEMGNYSEALSNVAASRKLYAEIGDAKNILVCDSLEERIYGEIRNITRNKAREYYASAEDYLSMKDYANALSYVNMSKKYYAEINDTEGIAMCESMYDSILSDKKENVVVEVTIPSLESEVANASKGINIVPILAVVLVIVIIILMKGLVSKRK